MNKERMILLADLLDSIKPEKFNIIYWASDYNEDTTDYSCQGDIVDLSVYNCNTAGCIAGWAVAMKNDLQVNDVYLDRIEEMAKDYLDLSYEESQRLFYYGGSSVWSDYGEQLGLDDNEKLTGSQAAIALREIAAGNWEL
jgi:hypothetical protein